MKNPFSDTSPDHTGFTPPYPWPEAMYETMEEPARPRASLVLTDGSKHLVPSTCIIEALRRLAVEWSRRAKNKYEDAEHEKNAMGRRLIEHGAICYANAARELEEVLLKNVSGLPPLDIPTELKKSTPRQAQVFSSSPAPKASNSSWHPGSHAHPMSDA